MNKKFLANTLTFSGAIPIAFFIFFDRVPIFDISFDSKMALISYGAIILSFLAGINFGFAIYKNLSKSTSIYLLIFSVSISLFSFAIMIFNKSSKSLLLLILGFSIQFISDYFVNRFNVVEKWFIKLRFKISVIVIFLLLFAYFY